MKLLGVSMVLCVMVTGAVSACYAAGNLSTDLCTIGDPATGARVLPQTTTVVASGSSLDTTVSVKTSDGVFQNSTLSAAESKTSGAIVYNSGYAVSSGYAFTNASMQASFAVDGLSVISPSPVYVVPFATQGVNASVVPVRYVATGSIGSLDLTPPNTLPITTTLTSTGTYTRTIDVMMSPTHTTAEPEVCNVSTVFVTVTGRVTISMLASSSSGFVTALNESGTGSVNTFGASEADGGTGRLIGSSYHQSVLTGTPSVSASLDTSGASGMFSSVVGVSPSQSSGKASGTNSNVTAPSTSPFLTPNHPSINITMAGAGLSAKAQGGLTLSLIVAFVGSMLLFTN